MYWLTGPFFCAGFVVGNFPKQYNYNDDYAIETTTINIKSKNVTQTAEYVLGGSGFDEDEEYWDEEE